MHIFIFSCFFNPSEMFVFRLISPSFLLFFFATEEVPFPNRNGLLETPFFTSSIGIKKR